MLLSLLCIVFLYLTRWIKDEYNANFTNSNRNSNGITLTLLTLLTLILGTVVNMIPVRHRKGPKNGPHGEYDLASCSHRSSVP